ncbi:MAG: hypothetical protein KA314_03720 [Chloroflexi bacterium]|nr:hypothetical protein [Chloroflexota bacterium]MBP8054922.1 hypothetical protein [Chloroflexota bacterium]
MNPQSSSTNMKLERTRNFYESPAIIYEGTISTRAGSPIGPISPSDERSSAPTDVDLFDDGN